MAKVVLQGSEAGLHIPPRVLTETGAALDSEFEVEVKALPGEREIQLRALAFVGHKLGHALGVGSPVRQGDGWRVEVVSPDAKHCLGHVALDRSGTVIAEQSATYASVRAVR